MTYSSGASVNVSYFRDLGDNNSIVLNPGRLDDTRSMNSQKTSRSHRSFSQGVRTPGFSSVPFSDVITKINPDGDPPTYNDTCPDLNSSQTGRSQNSGRHGGIRNSCKNGRLKTLLIPRPAVHMLPRATSKDAISGHTHRSYHKPVTAPLANSQMSGRDNYRVYMAVVPQDQCVRNRNWNGCDNFASCCFIWGVTGIVCLVIFLIWTV